MNILISTIELSLPYLFFSMLYASNLPTPRGHLESLQGKNTASLCLKHEVRPILNLESFLLWPSGPSTCSVVLAHTSHASMATEKSPSISLTLLDILNI